MVSTLVPQLGVHSPAAKELRVVVLGGGASNERNVSLRTARAMVAACAELGHSVSFLDPSFPEAELPDQVETKPFFAAQAEGGLIQNCLQFVARLSSLRPDVVLNGLHGGWGEDGTIQGLLEYIGIPYSHCRVAASALAMDKQASRIMFAHHDLAIARGGCFPASEVARRHVMPPPYVIKPRRGGSSVGVTLVGERDDPPACGLSGDDWSLDDEVLVEEFIAGRELTCAVVGDRPLEVIEITTLNNFYDFSAKYEIGGSKHEAAETSLPASAIAAVQSIALQAHRALGCNGITRSDFRLRGDTPHSDSHWRDNVVVLETNTQPGMTETSLVPDAVRALGYHFVDAIQWMIEDALNQSDT